MTWPVVNGLRSIEFGNPGASREHLNRLILEGKKRATAGLLEWDYQAENELPETVGERLAVLSSDGKHIATIEATRVEVIPFGEVPDEFALAEGEGDLDASDFRASHIEFWSKSGFDISNETLVVTLYFNLVEVME